MDRQNRWTEEDLAPIQYAVGAVIKKQDGKILTMFHKKLGAYSIPVGKVELTECPSDNLRKATIIRELQEELGIEVILRNVQQLAYEEQHHTRGEVKITAHTYIYAIEEFDGVIENKEPEKHYQLMWMSHQY